MLCIQPFPGIFNRRITACDIPHWRVVLEQPNETETPVTATAPARVIRFKKLILQGFKSFPEQTELAFEDSICAIVGPNGCGKSNILDALRWVLGEQGPSQLRARSMSDVIFNGTTKRKPVGMAEITLIIECPAGALPLAFDEIAITRRLYRSGESEYFINRAPCRLKDITDLFLDTGIGKGAYSLIEQGRVDALVTARPEERRVFLEQIAGIEKYKVRKKEALSRLASTENNLARVRDVISEVHSRRVSLARQARKAIKYRSLKTELDDLQKVLSGGRCARIQHDLHHLAARMEHLENTMSRTAAQLGLQSVALQESRKRVDAAQTHLRQTGDTFDQIENRIDYLENRIRDFDDRRRELDTEIENELHDADSLDSQCIDLNRRSTLLDEELAGLTRQSGIVSQEVDALDSRRLELDGRISRLHKQLADARARRLKQITGCSDLRNRILSGEERLRYLTQRLAELKQETERLAAALNDASRLHANITRDVARLESALNDLRGRLDAAAAAKCAAVSAFQETGDRLRVLEKERLSLLSRMESLQEIDAAGEGLDSGVRHVLKRFPRSSDPRPDVPSIIGTLAELYDTADEHEEAVTAALYTRLQDIIVAENPVFDVICEFLSDSQPGRVTIRRMPASGSNRDCTDKPPSGTLPLNTCITTSSTFKPLFSELLTGMFLAPDAGTAARAAAERPDAVIVTPCGLRWGPGHTRTFGRPVDNRPVYRRRRKDIADLKTREEACAAQVQTVLRDYESGKQHLQNTEAALSGIQERFTGMGQELAVARGECDHRQHHLEETSRRHTAALEETDTVAGEADRLKEQLDSWRMALEELETQTDIPQELNRLETDLEKAEKDASVLRDTLTEKRIRARSVSDRAEFAGRERARLKDEIKRLVDIAGQHRRQAEAKREQVDTGSTRRKALADELEKLVADTPVRQHRLESLKAQLVQAQRAEQDIAAQLAELERSDRALERELADVRVQKASLETAGASLAEDLSWDPAEEAEKLGRIPDDTELSDWKHRIETLQQSVSLFSDVNLGAEQEHRELVERSRFLDEQMQDLEHAIHSLRTTIQQINRTSRLRFMDAFDAVTEHFGVIFRGLFGGGEATLELINPDDPLESGVDIVCKPPGKRARTIDLLSGGEKALAALALLLAGFKYKPSPLLFLDEVDAPLDEHNVSRFTTFLVSLSDITQVVMITHNAQTMEAADILYGVTMEEPGISKLVSARLSMFTTRS
jgi:chromosome segregation protein